MSQPRSLLSVVLLAVPETTPGAVYGMHEVLSGVGSTWSALTGEPEQAVCGFRPVIASRDGRAFTSSTGARIVVDAALEAVSSPDIVIVSDLAVDMSADPQGRWPHEAAWVRQQHAAGALICSICTGSVLLAETGLLNGTAATTHWAAAPLFRQHYPAVRLEPARILCPAGPEHRIVTAGGASSWTDLALYLVARFCGDVEARRMARVFLIGDHSDGQLPFAARARPRQHDDALIADVQVWIAGHYHLANPVARMAARAGLPARTFARRFRRATGYAPAEYVQGLRIEEAKQLLEATDESTDAVAAAVGYADPASFRRLFKRCVGVTPSRYRSRLAGLAGVREAVSCSAGRSPRCDDGRCRSSRRTR
jgi:transcriptional regulator GlxA family with amidase domain